MKWKLAQRFRKFLVPFAVLLLGGACVVGASLLPERTREAAPTERPPVNVAVLPIQPLESLPDTVTLPAGVEPNRVVNLTAEVGGRVDRIPAVEGRRVEAGDVLVEINTDFLQAAYDSALAQAEFAENEYRRITDLTRRQVTTDADLDRALSQQRMARAALADARTRLERAVIRAPIAGHLNRISAEVGEVVAAGFPAGGGLGLGEPLAQIVDVDTVKVVFQAPERDVAFFRLGQKAVVEAEREGGRTVWEGRIGYIGALAEERTRTTRVEILVDNADRRLVSGQIVRARLVRRDLQDAIMIPLAAVIPAEEGHMVYVAEGGEARPRPVQLGLFRGRFVRVVSGLEPEDLLIVAGHRYVGPGQKVAVQETRDAVTLDDLGGRGGLDAGGR